MNSIYNILKTSEDHLRIYAHSLDKNEYIIKNAIRQLKKIQEILNIEDVSFINIRDEDQEKAILKFRDYLKNKSIFFTKKELRTLSYSLAYTNSENKYYCYS